jgi:glucosamine-phosphate N-acetyltransferase
MACAYYIRPLEASDYNQEYLTLLEGPGVVSPGVPEFDVAAYPGRIFVAVSGEEHIVATASCFLEPKCTHGGAPVAHLEDVVTAAAHRRKGLASELLREVRAFAIERGCRKIVLNCSEHYLGFYANAGFSRVGALMRMDL